MLFNFSVEDIVDIDDKGYVITAISPTSVTLREEQDADMDCGQPPSAKQPSTPRLIALKDLYDDGCHLLMTYRYTRGC